MLSVLLLNGMCSAVTSSAIASCAMKHAIQVTGPKPRSTQRNFMPTSSRGRPVPHRWLAYRQNTSGGP